MWWRLEGRRGLFNIGVACVVDHEIIYNMIIYISEFHINIAPLPSVAIHPNTTLFVCLHV
jgi:hypothetical protein